MIETYKVLGSMLALKEFTVNSLADYCGVNRATVDGVLRRNRQFWEPIEEPDGQGGKKKRGGQSVRHRVRPQEVEKLQGKIKELFNEVKNVAQPQAERGFPEARPGASRKPPASLPSLMAGDEALLYLFPKARNLEEKQTLLAAAESDLKSGNHEIEMLSKRATDNRDIEAGRALLHRVRTLKELAETEIALETGRPLRGNFDPRSLMKQLLDSLQYLTQSGDTERVEALQKRIINGNLLEKIGANPFSPELKPIRMGNGDRELAKVTAAAIADFENENKRVARVAAAAGMTDAVARARRSAVGYMPSNLHAIAVLPLSTSNVAEEYVGHGVTQGIARSLSLFPNLAVVQPPPQHFLPRCRVEAGNLGAIRSIGRELEVEAVLVGAVESSGDLVHCDTLLVGTSMDKVWRQRYDPSFADLFKMEADISRTVSQAFNIDLPRERVELIGKQPTDNSEAQRLYMEGRYHWSRWSAAGLRKAIECYEKALEKDFEFALAYAGLADCYNMLTYCTPMSPREAFTQAKANAYEALEYDDSMAEAYTSLAYAKARYYWKWSEAEEDYLHALELSPSYTIARQWYAEFLAGMGRFPEAQAQINLAQELEPRSPIVSVTRGSIYYFNRQYDLAIKQFTGVLEDNPDFLRAHFRLGGTYVQVGRYVEAVTHLEKALRLSNNNMRELALLGYAHAASGNEGKARELLSLLRRRSGEHYVASYNLALIHTALGEFDAALDRLEEAIEQKSPWLTFIKVDPRFDPIREQPRFRDVVATVGLAE